MSISHISTLFPKQVFTCLETTQTIQIPKRVNSLSIPLIFLISLSAAFSCTDREESIVKFAEFYDVPLEDYSQFVFVPNDGCGSCIREGKAYITTHIDNPEILHIYVSRFHSDLSSFKDKTNFFLDKQMKALDFGIVSTGAMIYEVEKDSLYIIPSI